MGIADLMKLLKSNTQILMMIPPYFVCIADNKFHNIESMLSEREKHHLIPFFERMSLPDVIFVANHFTKKMLNPTTFQDAVTIIFQHAPDVHSILTRQRVHKATIYKYLHDQQVPIPTSADKYTLVTLLIKYWNENEEEEVENDDSMEMDDNIENRQVVPVQTIHSQNQTSNSNNHNAADEFHEALCLKFVDWFYAKFAEPVKFGGENFFQNVTFKCVMNRANNLDAEIWEMEGAQDVTDTLHEIKSRYALLFSHNPMGVVFAKQAHGQVLITVGGSLHSGGACVGLFEQAFIILQDPVDNFAWKILRTEMRLQLHCE